MSDVAEPVKQLGNTQAQGRLVYHYTSYKACEVILSTRTLRAGPARNSNDETEFEDGLLHALDRIEYNFLDYDSAGIRVASAEIRSELSRALDRVHPFVSCFCANGDSLDLWGRYCPDGGVALGFDAEHLRVCAGTELVSCIYSDEDKRVAFDQLASQALFNWGPSSEGGSQPEKIIELLPEILALAARMKHPGFAVEEEVRLLWLEQQFARYREFSLIDRKSSGGVSDIGVRRVIIARIDNFDSRSEQVHRYFNSARLVQPEIVRSKIPIRKKPTG